jgi:hypothetical protein
MAFLGQENFTPAAEEPQAPRFLSLAPTTSASYPSTPAAKSPTPQSSHQAATEIPSNTPADPTAARTINPSAVPGASVIDGALKIRRSSSLSSDGSAQSTQKRRYLKLGPVHFGESKDDWSEEVLE